MLRSYHPQGCEERHGVRSFGRAAHCSEVFGIEDMSHIPNPLSRWCRITAMAWASVIAVFLLSLEYRFGYAGGPMPVGISHGALWLGEINTPDRGAGWFVAPNKMKYIVWWGVPAWHGRSGPRFILPLWIPIILIGSACAVGILKSVRRSREGHCHCGYNLRGNRSGICPECGTPITPPR